MPQTSPDQDTDLRRRPRQRRSRDTVAFVLEAAAQLFGERGYDATTTNAVAERAGVSIGTLYQYFASKDGLLVGLLDQHLDTAQTLAAATLQNLPTGRPDVVAAALVQLTAEHNVHRPQLARLLHEQAPRNDRLQARLVELRRTIAARLATRSTSPEAREAPSSTAQLRIELRADLCVRLVEHLVHATALDPPPGADRADVLAEITAVAAHCLSDIHLAAVPDQTRVHGDQPCSGDPVR